MSKTPNNQDICENCSHLYLLHNSNYLGNTECDGCDDPSIPLDKKCPGFKILEFKKEIEEKKEENNLRIRVCASCLYPVGLMDSRPEFVCLLKYHRMEIEDTKQIKTSEYLLPRLVTSRVETMEERNKLKA